MPNNSRKAIYYSFITEYSTQILAFISMMILARLLTPEEVGIYSVSITLILLAQNVTSFGVGQYIIQEKELTEQKLKTAIGFSYITAWTVGLIILFTSSAVSRFYNETGIIEIFNVLSIYFLLMPFAGIIEPCLRRDLKFDVLYKILFFTRTMQVCATLALAFLGFSYMSMAWGLVIEKLLYVIAINYYRPKYVPVIPAFTKVKEIFLFGSFLSAAGISKKIRVSFPELVIAKISTMEITGYYSRAYGAIQIFNKIFTQAITQVVLPHFALEKREGNENSYLQLLSLFTAFSFPFFCFLFLMAYPIVHILYGDQWDASVPIVQLLCVWASITSMYNFSGQHLIANGKVKYLLSQELILLPITIGIIYFISPFGVFYIAGAISIVAIIDFLYTSHLLYLSNGIKLGQILFSIWKSIFITLTSMLIPLLVLILSEMGPDNIWTPFLLSMVGAFLGWILGIFLVNHKVKAEIAVFASLAFQQLKSLSIWKRGR